MKPRCTEKKQKKPSNQNHFFFNLEKMEALRKMLKTWMGVLGVEVMQIVIWLMLDLNWWQTAVVLSYSGLREI